MKAISISNRTLWRRRDGDNEIVPDTQTLRQSLQARLSKAINSNNFNEIEIYTNLLRGHILEELSQRED